MPKLLKEHIFCKLNFYSERMQKCLHSATQKYIDSNVHDDPKVFDNMYFLIIKIISTPVANVFIGEEESKNDEVVATFAEFTSDLSALIKIPPFLNFFYPGLLNRILVSSGLYNPAIKHRNILIKYIKNQVCKRLQEKAKYADKLLLFLFASIHTTSNGCANALMDLASRPQYVQELYEEQLEVHKEADENGVLPFEALDNMKKLDSFIRESLRLTGHILALDHSVLKDYTFSNGLQLPKDHTVKIYVDDIYQDELLQHVDTNVPASKIGKNFMLFGGGKHACPGRHFAINEINFFLYNIILKYNICTKSGKIEGRRMYSPTAYPSSSGIIIEKRVK
ncbi:hypothetical protein RirG_252990 [Rhizophagus irregularis DAOM 197198w]|uniref:Cytochrome P450 n=2 Tax=Rhizophagus irregularis TaxID=588596 RepID=A0A015LC77_RHIIW|nr:hypothetical protein RirG_252990 [Rhizophagus irregularis DAOM 197198w]